MKLKWGIYAPCINEIQLIEAKIKWGLRLFDDIVIVEGAHPFYTNTNKKGLSIDGTTEILESYSDQITYLPIGRVTNESELRSKAYKGLKKDLDIVIMSDIDEYYTDKDLEFLDDFYYENPEMLHTIENSYIFLTNKHCSEMIHWVDNPNAKIQYEINKTFLLGEWHERIFRYSKYYGYGISPFLINDLLGRFPFLDPSYIGKRKIFSDIFRLHYKNFKMQEQMARLAMYDKVGGTNRHQQEMSILQQKKIEYRGVHPKEIEILL